MLLNKKLSDSKVGEICIDLLLTFQVSSVSIRIGKSQSSHSISSSGKSPWNPMEELGGGEFLH